MVSDNSDKDQSTTTQSIDMMALTIDTEILGVNNYLNELPNLFELAQNIVNHEKKFEELALQEQTDENAALLANENKALAEQIQQYWTAHYEQFDPFYQKIAQLSLEIRQHIYNVVTQDVQFKQVLNLFYLQIELLNNHPDMAQFFSFWTVLPR
jgi:hydroxymethylpyrimidine pyrophosphatase-like HAD family hydrolase